MLSQLSLFIKKNYYLFKIIRTTLVPLGYWQKKTKIVAFDEQWNRIIEEVVKSPDNKEIPRVKNAGRIVKDYQIMHNGIKVHVGSYYGNPNTVLLYKNKGVHEPQEEKVFEQVIATLPEGATMIELGAFWGFYSMSFLNRVKNGKSYLIEPDIHALLSGQNNFKLNNFSGKFFNYFIKSKSSDDSVPSICIDDFVEQNKIPFVNILHSDIQGYELEMLQGSVKSMKARKIGYFFISTHSNELHEECMSILKDNNYTILSSANLDQTCSWDGVIVARQNEIDGPVSYPISIKS